jgi:phosphoribosyl 1,2-cyclic phosphodiesterase
MLGDIRFFRAGDTLVIGDVSVQTIPTPHDGEDGAVFVVESAGDRLGVLTDLGHVFDGLDSLISSLDAVIIESNYDPTMLARGPYPRYLKRRIQGPGGHISNIEAAELLRSVCGSRLKWACLAHLSEQNNSPALALKTHHDILNGQLKLHIASRYACSPIFSL